MQTPAPSPPPCRFLMQFKDHSGEISALNLISSWICSPFCRLSHPWIHPKPNFFKERISNFNPTSLEFEKKQISVQKDTPRVGLNQTKLPSNPLWRCVNSLWSWIVLGFKMPSSLIVPHFQGPFLWELLGTGASLFSLHLSTSQTQPPSPGVNRPRTATFLSGSWVL